MEKPYPTRIHVHYAALPKASRDHIVALSRAASDVRRIVNPAPTGMFLGALALGVLILLKFQSATPLVFIFTACFAWLIGTRVIAPHFFFSPFHYLHPAYVLDAGYGLLHAHPIWHLSSIEVVHNLRNGSYQHSDVKLSFGNDLVIMTAQSREQAQSLASLAALHRDAALKMLSLDSFTSIEGYDLIPQSAVTPESKTSKTWIVFVAALVAGAIAVEATAPYLGRF